MREEDAIASAVLQRIEVEWTTLDDEEARARSDIETLEGRIAQLDHDRAREESLSGDADASIARLAEEAAELTAEHGGHAARLAAANAEADEAAAALGAREALLSEQTENAARVAARHHSAERRVEEARKTAARCAAEADKTSRAAKEAADKLGALHRQHDDAQAALAAAADLSERAEATLLEAEAERNRVQSAESEVRAERADADGHLGTLEAEIRALGKLLERERNGGAQILDEVQVEAGFEAAIGAALADDLKAPRDPAPGASGWHGLPGYPVPQPLPAGTRALSEVARGPAALDRRLGQVGLVAAEDGARLQPDLLPGQRLVSREGDLWRWDGYVQTAGDASSTAARRLTQMNQLDALRAERDRAQAAADDVRARHAALSKRLSDLTEADGQARGARREADRRLAEANRAASRLEADRNIVAGQVETLRQSAARFADEAKAGEAELAQAEAAHAELEDLDALKAALATARQDTEAARLAMIARRTTAGELKRDGEARESRLVAIAKEQAGWATRAETAGARIAELLRRKSEAEDALSEAVGKPAALAEKRSGLAQAKSDAEARKAASADALVAAERGLRAAIDGERSAERQASEAREARAASEARRDGAAQTADAAVERIEEEMDCAPAALLESLEADPDALPAAGRIEGDVSRLRRQRDALGAVNLRAEEDAKSVQEEHDTLVSEKADLEAAIAKLRAGIAALNKEGRERLLAAFDQVNENFSTLFTHLFGGGEAKLVLVESDDPLEAGLEILCQPPGKKLSTLSLLSGGEQTLTALALIFAVFLANPAPICVLDEVDAPLDDANVGRFCDLLDEMCRRTDTRFLIITHHAVTMARMDRLFGVTMAEQGVSQLVSVDLSKAEQMVA